MPTTPIYALPYPAAADPADVPLDLQKLAERTELVFPGSELAYAERTTNLAIPTSAESAPTDVVSTPATAYDGRPVLVEFFAPRVWPNVTAGVNFNLWDGNTNLGILAFLYTQGTTEVDYALRAARRLTPSAGSHTYRIRAWATAGTANLVAGAGGPGAFVPAFIRVSRI
jgi:hypothetical protein